MTRHPHRQPGRLVRSPLNGVARVAVVGGVVGQGISRTPGILANAVHSTHHDPVVRDRSDGYTVPTAYDFRLPDQNGWSRYLHFQSAWLLLFTGLAYVWIGARRKHFRTHFVPSRRDRSWRALRASVAEHLRFNASAVGDAWSYNALQRLSYTMRPR